MVLVGVVRGLRGSKKKKKQGCKKTTKGGAQEPPLDAHHCGCPGTPDPRNSSVNNFLCRAIPWLRAPWAEPTGIVNLGSSQTWLF